MSKAPRVVLDTNVVLSALIFAQGRLAPLRRAWQGGRCAPLVSRATTEELLRVLGYPKFKLSAAEQRELVADYLPHCTTVRMPLKPPHVPPCRDSCDKAFLELAAVGKADCLVTGDKDLSSISGSKPCPIVTPDRFLASLVQD